MYDTKCRNCGLLWVEHSRDSRGPYCIRTYRPEMPPDDGTTEQSLLKQPWFATLTQRQVVLLTRIAEAAIIAVIIGLLLSVLNLRK